MIIIILFTNLHYVWVFAKKQKKNKKTKKQKQKSTKRLFTFKFALMPIN